MWHRAALPALRPALPADFTHRRIRSSLRHQLRGDLLYCHWNYKPRGLESGSCYKCCFKTASLVADIAKVGYLLERKLPQNAMVGKEPKAPKGPQGPKKLTVLLRLFLQQLLRTRPWQLDGSRARPVSTDPCISRSCSRPAQSDVDSISWHLINSHWTEWVRGVADRSLCTRNGASLLQLISCLRKEFKRQMMHKNCVPVSSCSPDQG